MLYKIDSHGRCGGQKWSGKHVAAHTSRGLSSGSPYWCGVVAWPAASPISGPGVYIFSSETKCSGLCRIPTMFLLSPLYINLPFLTTSCGFQAAASDPKTTALPIWLEQLSQLFQVPETNVCSSILWTPKWYSHITMGHTQRKSTISQTVLEISPVFPRLQFN